MTTIYVHYSTWVWVTAITTFSWQSAMHGQLPPRFHLYTLTELGRLLVTWGYSTPLTTESVQSPYLLNLHLMAMHVCGHDVAFSQHTSDIASALKCMVGCQNVTHVGTQLHLMWHASVTTNGIEQLQYMSTAWIHHYCQWRWWGVVCMVVASWM